jgi:ubiquinone/menaquinone biosynthesis C-methylase UbiE
VDEDDPAYRGQADYTPSLLRLYDPVILGPIFRFVWRCPADILAERYRQHIQPRHLDVGPGTGYFLEQAGVAAGGALTLLDPNPNVLRYAAERLSGLSVTVVEADVCKPLPVTGPFDSAALNLVIHCLPGPFERKAAAIHHVASVLSSDGVLFGSSILGTTGSHNRVARALLTDYNRRRVFDNLADSEETITEMLERSFGVVEIETHGSIAIFTARRPTTAAASWSPRVLD